ncbi:HAD-IB family phosphatase [Flavihumibacter sp. CACIAM 22H1]|uniref:HAD-IB family phosphatase n=1 Tax=Flavihumibacter sp. CACIAM 22H1 TaxID=1812911 RepID=UPI0007A80CDB|nr:HAD-IB family phosphatase [Flavihumibacter sp. CACIAM 22H1]KYP13562.1 MAG: glycosyl transferase family 2 [Flavihumibacter sp. CACIAM 22H1]
MVTIIIPALNEAHTIAQVVKYCLSKPVVSQVIVVDDQSVDNTVMLAKEAGAEIILSAVRGKGISMKEGIQAARNEHLIFLDGDIEYPDDTIDLLARPLLENEADFVKATFSRNAGRVTELVAKPLLSIFYPGLAHFSQPLSGMIAGRKQFFARIDFFQDYGVDIGILIDMFLMRARILEVAIGHIENKSKPWHALGKMSREVTRAIIMKAMRQKNELVNLNELELVNLISSEMKSVMEDQVTHMKKMVVFDMDHTILKGSFIEACADKYGFRKEYDLIKQHERDASALTKRVSLLLKGLSMDDLLQTATEIPMIEDIQAVVGLLKQRGYLVGIVSESYHLITEYVKNKIGADFCLSNQLEYFEGKATGEVRIPSYFYHTEESSCSHPICKTNALRHLSKRYEIPLENSVAVADGENDLCIIEQAGVGIAFCTTNELVRFVADGEINEPAFSKVLQYAN